MTHEHHLAGAYALDALDDDERTEFESHLHGCDPCQAEVAELLATTEALAAAAALTPPAGLRQQVLSEIDHVRQDRPVITLDESRRRDGRTRAAHRGYQLVAAALVLVVVGLSAVALTLNRRLGDATDRATTFAEVVAAPDVVRVVGASDDGVTISALIAAREGLALVTPHNLPAAPAGHGYALWILRDDAAIPVDRLSDSTVHVAFGTADALGVTIEPDGVLDQPSMAPIVTVEV